MSDQQNDVIVDEPSAQLLADIEGEIASVKRRPFRDLGQVHSYLAQTVLPLIRDVHKAAIESRGHVLDEVADYVEDRLDEGEETQFTPDDAKLFRDTVVASKTVIESILPSLEGDKQEPLVKLLGMYDDCLRIIEANTLVVEDEEVPREPTEEQPS